jgi:hypothetical protein
VAAAFRDHLDVVDIITDPHKRLLITGTMTEAGKKLVLLVPNLMLSKLTDACRKRGARIHGAGFFDFKIDSFKLQATILIK